jgi:2-succinyl-5-enolpyruvyl-6-hydroxy-3-cyclohexene-1-carboxylate synthase
VTQHPVPATAWSTRFLESLIGQGVHHLVISPGSRSQALALAAMAFDDHDEIPFSVTVAIDERTAGFFALGVAMDSARPVALLCTSGTAPGHYLPAIMEAHHSGVGLIAITADRPEELIGVGANQTTWQPGIFGVFCRTVIDIDAPVGDTGEEDQARDAARLAWAEASGQSGSRPGPVQVNVSFTEPLSSAQPQIHPVSADVFQPWSASALTEPRTLQLQPLEGTLVVAGHGAGPEAEELARSLGAPLIAEVHSGSHFGPHLVVAYRDLLNNPPTPITRVVCVGRPTLSREVWALLSRTDIDQVVWQKSEPVPAHPSGVAVVADLVSVIEPVDDQTSRVWSGPWVAASRQLLNQQAAELDAPSPNWEANTSSDMATRSGFAKEELAVFKRPLTRRSIAQGVWEATWPHDRLVVASSRMIRELDKVAPGKNITALSTRGLSGIDGQIALSRGVSRSVAHLQGGTVRVLLGDVAFFHDVGSLMVDVSETAWGRVHLYVVADGGGSIFDALEVSATATPEHFDRVLFTPVEADIAAIAKGFSWDYLELTQFGQLPEALQSTANHLIVHCRVARKDG